jgi:hypothetical protein
MPRAVILLVAHPILTEAFARIGLLVVAMQPTLELLGPALLLRRLVPFSLLLAERRELPFHGGVARTWRVGHDWSSSRLRRVAAAFSMFANATMRSVSETSLT